MKERPKSRLERLFEDIDREERETVVFERFPKKKQVNLNKRK